MIAKIDTAAAAAPSAQPAAETTAPSPAAESPTSAHPAAGVPSPAAAKMMAEQGIEASAVQATGPGGRITKGDVIAQAGANRTTSSSPAPAPSPSPVMSGARRATSPDDTLAPAYCRTPVEAQTAAILTTFNEVNMGPVMEMRKRLKDDFEKKHGTRLAEVLCQSSCNS